MASGPDKAIYSRNFRPHEEAHEQRGVLQQHDAALAAPATGEVREKLESWTVKQGCMKDCEFDGGRWRMMI